MATDTAKRIFDVLFSLAMLLALSPFILIVMILLVLEHALRGRPLDPVFYSEERITKGEKFKMFKFNIFRHEKILEMQKNNIFVHTKSMEKNGGLITTGRALKQIYMDELPQLWNVLEGRMSMVGPRPVNPVVYEKLPAPARRAKDAVKAGITGYFQSLKNSKIGKADKLDEEYVRYYFDNPWYRVIFFDLKIMLYTVKVILSAKGI